MRYWKKYILLTILLSLWTAGHILWQLSLQLPSELEGETLLLTGEIISDPIKKQNSTRFIFKTKPYGKIQLDWYRTSQPVQKGQEWEFSVRLKKPRNYDNPGGFNYARFLFLNRINATGYVYDRVGAKLIVSPPEKINIRQRIAQFIDHSLDERPQAALIKGLAVGIRDTMTDKQWELLQKTGTSHLLAISGLHIGLVSGLIFFLARYLVSFIPRLPLYVPAPIIGAISAIIAAIVYAALAGFSVPTQRALIMIMVAMLCFCARQKFKNRHILIIAGILIIILDPFALMSASFWLSFLAVAVLFTINLQQAPKWRKFVTIQWYISLGLTPLVIIYFQQISWISPVANLIAIPWASFTIVPLTLLGVVASFVDIKYATFFWLLAESAINHLQWYLNYLAQLPWSWQIFTISDLRIWFAIIVGSLLLLLPRGFPCKSLGFILFTAIFFAQARKPVLGEAWVTVLDVGQGLAIVVQTAEHVLLYDAGMRFDQFDLGEAVILPFLRHQGIKKIDTLILSHNNLDHTGGAHYLIKNIPVKTIISGEAITDIQSTQRCRAGQSWQWDQINFEFLYPIEENRQNSNNNSCVLKISTHDTSTLLTGDIEKTAEAWLVKHAADSLKTNILIAPHHGSKTSSTAAFIAATSPDQVIFSTGYKNRYSFPNKAVLARYLEKGIDIRNTADEGAIRYSVTQE